MRQVEVSPTLVLDAPRHGQAFFDALVRDDLGRQDQVELVFGCRARADTPGTFATRVVGVCSCFRAHSHGSCQP